MPALGALFDDEVDTKPGCIADANTCAEEQVAQHTAPRQLALGCSTANQPTAASGTRVPQQNCFGVHVVEQTRCYACHNVRAEGAAACVARSKLQLVRQIGERGGAERFCHLGLQPKVQLADGDEVGGGALAFESCAVHACSNARAHTAADASALWQRCNSCRGWGASVTQGMQAAGGGGGKLLTATEIIDTKSRFCGAENRG